eukprot:s1031_g27.t1
MLQTKGQEDGRLRGEKRKGVTKDSRSSKKTSSTPKLQGPVNTEVSRLLSIRQIQVSKLSTKPSTQQLRAALRGKNRGERLANRNSVFKELELQPRFPGQTLLEQRAVSASVARDYRLRYQEFLHFSQMNGMSLQSETSLDAACCIFLNHMFFEGKDISEGSKLFASVLDAHPNFGHKQSLMRSRRALQGWAKLDPGNTRPPIAWALIAKIGMMMLGHGKVLEALAITLMFVCYLRPGEALALLEEDLTRPGSGLKHFALNLHPASRQEESKVGLQDETILIDSSVVPGLGLCLQRQLTGDAKSPLLKVEYTQLKREWETCFQELGLASNHAVLYQLRHSGPSHDRLMSYRHLNEVKKRGRWQSDSSLRRYENHARIAQEFQRLPTQIQAACILAETSFPKELQKSCCHRKRSTRKHGS